MEHGDKETIILINDLDRKQGFFKFSTSKVQDFTRFCKRIGGEENLIDIKYSRQGSEIVEYNCKVPIRYFSTKIFGVVNRKPSTMTEEQRLKKSERMKQLVKERIAKKD